MKNLITHISAPVKKSFEEFTAGIESSLGYFDRSAMELMKVEPAAARIAVEKMQGVAGLMLFSIEDHGAVLLMEGQFRKVKQYRVGNPLIAMTMTKHDVRAALYVPLSLIIYENVEGMVLIDYDLPSSILGQFGNEQILKVAKSLDEKLKELIDKANN